MLIQIVQSDRYEADTMKDIEDDYDILIGNVVFLKEEEIFYVVLPKDNDVGKLVKIEL